jgi:predicted Zn-dependent peptidase
MNARVIVAAAMLLGMSAVLTVPGAAESMQQRGELAKGGAYVLVPNPTVGAAAIGLWFRAPGAGYDNLTPGIAVLAATAAADAKLESGKSLVALVHSLGGQFHLNVYPDIIDIGVVVPSSGARRAVAALTAAYFAPTIDEAAVKAAQRDVAVLGVYNRYSASLTLHDRLFSQIFTDGPAHFPATPDTVAALTKITPAEVSAFAKRAFSSNNATLTLAGDVDASNLTAVTDGSGAAPMQAPFDSTVAPSPQSTTMPGVVQGVGLAWVGPPIVDEKAATAMDLVADYLFRDETGVVSHAIDTANTDAYVTGQFITLHDPGVMLVTVGGDDREKVRKRVLAELAKLAEPMDAQTFSAAREAFLYHLASDTQTPQQQSDNLGWYAAEGNGTYAPGDTGGAYERNARAIDPQYLAAAVRKYLSNPVIVNLITAAPKESAP